LRARLADALRGDDAHCLAVRDEPSPREVTPVAEGANATTRLTRQGRAHVHLIDTRGDHALGDFFCDFVSALGDNLAGFRVGDVSRGPTSDNPLAERFK